MRKRKVMCAFTQWLCASAPASSIGHTTDITWSFPNVNLPTIFNLPAVD